MKKSRKLVFSSEFLNIHKTADCGTLRAEDSCMSVMTVQCSKQKGENRKIKRETGL